MLSTPTSAPHASSRGRQGTMRAAAGQPSTPIIVPPTPSPSSNADPKISILRAHSPSGASSSSVDLPMDVASGDMQTKRRSLLRSAGTASSPDLATLVRKAKAKAAAAAGQLDMGRGTNSNQGTSSRNALSPNPSSRDGASSRTRMRSSTTVQGSNSSPSAQKGKVSVNGKNSKYLTPNTPLGSDWVMTSNPRDRSDTVVSKGKSSVRSKTSAFLGKIMGQGTFRDRSRNDPYINAAPFETTYSPSNNYYQVDAPPIPPLPYGHRSPSKSPIADVFSSTPSTPDVGKPLPPSPMKSPLKVRPVEESDNGEADIEDDASVVMVESSSSIGFESARSSSPDRTIKSRSPRALAHIVARTKRRSMSVSEADIKLVMNSSPAEPGRSSHKKRWDSTINNAMLDFTGQLSEQLDSISSGSLDLKDPSTPKRPSFGSGGKSTTLQMRRNSDQQILRSTSFSSPTASKPKMSFDTQTAEPDELTSSDETPVIVHHSPTAVEGAIAPPRMSSLSTPMRHASASATLGSGSRGNSIKYGPRQPRPGSSNGQNSSPATVGRDGMRLRVQHRSAASSSEPALIPIRDDDRQRDVKRTVRLVPSSPSVGWPEATSPAFSVSISSQTDLTGEDGPSSSRMTSSAPSRDESSNSELELRGQDLATKCWTEDEEFLPKEKIAEWLGGTAVINKVALRYYMNYFDFTGQRLDAAFRTLCAKLFLKAETQQVDRILEDFSRRYWETNSGTVYGSSSVVHAVAYSLLLLNTDLHVADLATRMSRPQFVRNTLSAIQMQIRSPTLGRPSTPELTRDDGSSGRLGSDGSDIDASTLRSRAQRSGSVNSWNSVTRDIVNTPATTPNRGTPTTQFSESSPSIQEPRIRNPSSTSVVYGRNFDNEMEGLLKELYSAIKSQQILQPQSHFMTIERASTSSLSPGHNLYRNRSQQRNQNDRVNNLKRGSMRGIQSLFAQGPYGSNNSLDGRISPAPSFATSNDHFGAGSAFLTPTLGFASNLSHTIIREAKEDDERSIRSDDSDSTNVSITDEELALLGAPWAKEGMLCRKQYWESSGKRAKSKAWLDVFVVIQQGELNMFVFGGDGGNGGNRAVGGGNWLSNAQSVGTVSLAHSLAHPLPPPGYNKQRPHCLVLTLASGGVYFFQAGTEELVNEWVSTCNYWAARQSKEPLAGGVSNMEYGWNRVEVEEGRTSSVSRDDTPPQDPDPTDAMSMRSGRSKLSKKDPFSLRGSPFSDRLLIHDWKLPMPSTVPSAHDEETQLEALQKHVAALKTELQQHNDLRTPMMHMYQPRSANANKALSNWEKKSQYLLTEIVKYGHYVDSLKSAMSLRLKKRGEKALEKALVVASPSEEGGRARRWQGPEEEDIMEADEPPPTPGFSSGRDTLHRRESAGVAGY